MTQGKVYIVGAGPGDPELLTKKACRLLQEAQVIVYDRLISEDILALIPTGTARIFAGKSCKTHTMPQEEINSLLVTLAQSGRNVVRLKGGDPFIFGRGSEEAESLAAASIEFEIVPGISSASGCSSYAGIPLTHRGLATGVRFFTGHCQGESLQEPALNWASLADPDTTLVGYMGLANVALISERLIAHGLSADTPAAAIQQGTTQTQRRVISTLHALPQAVKNAELQAPTLLIIGRVVALAETLDWFISEAGDTDKHESLPPQKAVRL